MSNGSPIVIGGLGGSGTRLVANVLRNAGVYIGDCLNEPLDNLWFTLLFRRPASIKSWSDLARLQPHLDLFDKRMHGNYEWSGNEKRLMLNCAFEFVWRGYVKQERLRFPRRVLKSFYQRSNSAPAKVWGWKEPNSHIFLPLLAERYNDIKYIHVLRHPLDMAFGKNFLQLRNWRHLFNISESDEQRAMLLYYEMANVRATTIGQLLGSAKFMTLKFEDLCNEPAKKIGRMLDFCQLETSADEKEKLYALPDPAASNTDYHRHNYEPLLPLARASMRQFDYSI